MELMPGYKQTELGLIPADWETIPLGRLTASVEYGSSAKSSLTGRIPVLRMGNLQGGQIDWANLVYTDDATEITKYTLYPGDVLFNRTNTIELVGKAALFKGGRAAIFAGYLIRIKVDKKLLDSRFLNYVLNTEFSKRYSTKVLSVAVGQANINGQKLRTYPVPVPPTKAEQEAIAEALGDTDGLIESLEQLIIKKRQIKHGAMQELLTGKKRLPGFIDEWEVKRLGELFEITSSKRVFQSEWTSEGIPFYRARELAVLGEAGRVDNELFIRESLYEEFKAAHGVPEPGDMLVTGVGTLGKVYVVRDDQKFYFKDGNIIWFKIRGSVSSEFLRQLYLTKEVMKQIMDGSAGTTVGTYTISGAKKTEIPFPSLAEQAAIASILVDADAELAALEQRLAQSRNLKQGMMQELLTGRIRLV
jgi:type I restriction enzyme, S subunit